MLCEVVPEGEVRAAPGGGAFSQDVITKCNELCQKMPPVKLAINKMRLECLMDTFSSRI